ncbi:MAG: DUF4003 family protein [Clostridia bacterium]|nr:DUF4003 family protein [Clostridia bacterium]
MDNLLLNQAEAFVSNKEAIRRAIKFSNPLLQSVLALSYSNRGIEPSENVLSLAVKIIRNSVGILSSLRGYDMPVLATYMALSPDSAAYMGRILSISKLLKDKFHLSSYILTPSVLIAETCSPDQTVQWIDKAYQIYQSIKKNHRFLTNSDDFGYCVLMAMNPDPEDTVQEVESIYSILRENKFSPNAALSLAMVLSLYDEDAELKCQRVKSLYDDLRKSHMKYDSELGLPCLGVLAMCGLEYQQLMDDMYEMYNWLSDVKGFGTWGSISSPQQILLTGMIVLQARAAAATENNLLQGSSLISIYTGLLSASNIVITSSQS